CPNSGGLPGKEDTSTARRPSSVGENGLEDRRDSKGEGPMSYFWKKVAALGFLVFLILWVVGILRSYTVPYPQPAWPLPVIEELSARNASANNLKQIGMAQAPLPAVLDQPEVDRIQVHEKHAQLATGTTAFDDDVGKARNVLAEHQATIFNEKNGGLAPERR